VSEPTRFRRRYENARDFKQEARDRLGDYDAILGSARREFEKLRRTGIRCRAFLRDVTGEPEVIEVTRQCWNHVFEHPIKRRSKVEKLERALALPFAVKLIERTTTYQGLSRETDRGGNRYDAFEIVGCIRGCRIKVIIKKQQKRTNARKILFSFYQLSGAPVKKGEVPPDPDGTGDEV
jgi:hypothetical protein